MKSNFKNVDISKKIALLLDLEKKCINLQHKMFYRKTISSQENNGDIRVHFNLVFVHCPLAVQTILRGPNKGVYPFSQDSTNSAPGLKNFWSPSISILAASSGLKQTAKTHGFNDNCVQTLEFAIIIIQANEYYRNTLMQYIVVCTDLDIEGIATPEIWCCCGEK